MLRLRCLATDANILQRTPVLVRGPACACGVGHWTDYQPLKPLSTSTGAHYFQVYIDCFVHTRARATLRNEFNVITLFFHQNYGNFFLRADVLLIWTVSEAEKSGPGPASLSLLIRLRE